MSSPTRRRTRESSPGAAAPEVTAADEPRLGLPGGEMSAPPADLVTSDRLKGVRFDIAQPRGYYTEQVDTLVKLLTSSLAWHEEALYQRDQGIHVLQSDLDAATQQEATLRAQVEVFQAQEAIAIGTYGTADENVRQSQMIAGNEALAHARGQGAALEKKLAASIEEVRSLREWADLVIPQTAQIAELAKVAQEQLEVNVQELAAGREKLVGMAAQVASLEAQVASLNAQQFKPLTGADVMAPAMADTPQFVAMLADPAPATPAEAVDIADTAPPETIPADCMPPVPADITPQDAIPADTIPADTTPADWMPQDTVPADTFEQAPAPAADPDAEEDQLSDDEDDWNLYDPELPRGVTLPRAKFDRSYIRAKPGDPLLVKHRSPLEVWAPELFAHQGVIPAAEPATGAPVQDDPWGAPLPVAVEAATATVVVQQGEAASSDVSDGVARPQLRRRV